MKIHVTGASGFVGRTLCASLALEKHTLVGAEQAEAIVHLAAIAHRRAAPEELHKVNVELAVRTARFAAATGARFVFLSSIKVHGESSKQPLRPEAALAPVDRYAVSKARAEERLRAIPGLHMAVLRPPLVYGPGVKGNFLTLLRAIARGWPLPLASVKNRRSLVYVENLADAILACLATEGTYLVTDGPAISTKQLCTEIGLALRRPARLFRWPSALLPKKLSGSLEVDPTTLPWIPRIRREDGLAATARWYLGG